MRNKLMQVLLFIDNSKTESNIFNIVNFFNGFTDYQLDRIIKDIQETEGDIIYPYNHKGQIVLNKQLVNF